ncbi:MAG: methyltransferase domain-containing protein [Kofleriaceae bacterium]|nr:methyltransferase domain-containing protein [Myxococcales bacterium]MCB9565289.1 methyltransferase domain-containing protein [Kofleriaceae bacterium]
MRKPASRRRRDADDDDAPRGAWADDDHFDRLLPPRWRAKSGVHFTPVDIARRAAELLVDRPGLRILDVGSGVGKFCLAAAQLAPEASFVGIEQRPHLVRIAQGLARRLRIRNVTFSCGDAFATDWSQFDGFYLFNPFAEQLGGGAPMLDRTIERSTDTFLHDIHAVRGLLADLELGTRVVTYHGFGASPPPGYQREADEPAGSDRLELWVKVDSGRRRRPTIVR